MATDAGIETLSSDKSWMNAAIALAARAEEQGEVPVGALVVKDGALVSEGWNQPITECDPTAHAEIKALRAAGDSLQNYRLNGCTLYVTLEPCAMCLTAMIHARIERVVFGAYDPKAGVCGGKINLQTLMPFNHHLVIEGGVCQSECSNQLVSFFKARR